MADNTRTLIEFFVRVNDSTSGITFKSVTLDAQRERADKIVASGNVKFYQFRDPNTGERWSWKAGRGWITHEVAKPQRKRNNKGQFVSA